MEVGVVLKGLKISQEKVWEDCQGAWGLSQKQLLFWFSSREEEELLELSLWELPEAPI